MSVRSVTIANGSSKTIEVKSYDHADTVQWVPHSTANIHPGAKSSAIKAVAAEGGKFYVWVRAVGGSYEGHSKYGILIHSQYAYKWTGSKLVRVVAASKAAAPTPPRPPAKRSSSSKKVKTHDVFISFVVREAGADPAAAPFRRGAGVNEVYAIKHALEAAGMSAFVCEEMISGAQDWIQLIQANIDSCKAFVAVCTPNFARKEPWMCPVLGPQRGSVWCYREITDAINKKKPIIPVYLSGVYPPPSVSLILGTTHVVNGPIPHPPPLDRNKALSKAAIQELVKVCRACVAGPG